MKGSIGLAPFVGKTPRLTGASFKPSLQVRHGSVLVTASPVMTHGKPYGYSIRITLGTGRGEPLDELTGAGFATAELAVQAAEKALARWQLPEPVLGQEEPRRTWTPREWNLERRRRLHGY
jgi:hypothetical protein